MAGDGTERGNPWRFIDVDDASFGSPGGAKWELPSVAGAHKHPQASSACGGLGPPSSARSANSVPSRRGMRPGCSYPDSAGSHGGQKSWRPPGSAADSSLCSFDSKGRRRSPDDLRPVTRETAASAWLHSNDIRGSRVIWRGDGLPEHLSQVDDEACELAHHRFDCARQAARTSRQMAQCWRQKNQQQQAKIRNDIALAKRQMAVGQVHLPLKSAATTLSPLKAVPTAARLSATCGAGLDDPDVGSRPLTPSSSRFGSRLLNLGQTAKPDVDSPDVDQATTMRGPAHTPEPERRRTLVEAGSVRRLSTAGRRKAITGGKKFLQKQSRSLKNRLRSKWMGQMQVSFEKEWGCLMEEEQDILRRCFNMDQNMTAYLNTEQLEACLFELGVRGRNDQETTDIRDSCAEHKNADVECMVCMLLPAVRRRLGDVMRPQLLEAFEKATVKADTESLNFFSDPELLKRSFGQKEQSRTLDMQEVQKLVESLACSTMSSTEAREALREAFKILSDILEMMRIEHETTPPSTQSTSQGYSFSRMASASITECFTEEGTRLNFAATEIMFQKCQEMQARIMGRKVKLIREQAQAALDEAAWELMERHVEPLYQVFKLFDSDNSGALDGEEVRGLLQEFGFLSGKPDEDAVVHAVVNTCDGEDGEWNFSTFICKFHEMREELKKRRHDFTMMLFSKFDKDGDGELSMVEVSNMLAEMGLSPTTTSEQNEIRHLVDLADGDGSGYITYKECQHLAQLVMERMRGMARAREMDVGVRLGFTPQRIREFRDAFWQLDDQGSGNLDIHGLRRAMRLLKQRINGDQLRSLFAKVDIDGNGFVDFCEFLKLMACMDEAESRNAAQVAEDANEAKQSQELEGQAGMEGMATSTRQKGHLRQSGLAATLSKIM
eukprot:TRINITY_DN74687_c0_g1_i1.p1 TRINITY_DN74687_c0_g1~~TRINITY_DN74687_c0_g1_i1.p1  ORF type:complete len:894 (-),score=176.62 TRINITY_DN74687_c0_g1_i1:177-2858(-)